MPWDTSPVSPPLPATDSALVVRTSFALDDQWPSVVALFRSGASLQYCDAVLVDDVQWAGASEAEVKAALPERSALVLFVADSVTLAAREMPFLVLNPQEDEPVFRCRAVDFGTVYANLTLGNVDWDEVLQLVDDSGVYRG